ncbi:Mov34/MPN/PAD-1 family protein [Acinetobacter lactucae]|uniref:Mov34/MPN/PAD-1 family protein n=1 Tax=Acinetobacter lactucae TaxID=1785128 RepID=UPI0039F73AF3
MIARIVADNHMKRYNVWKIIIDHQSGDEIFIVIDKNAIDNINSFRQKQISQAEACGVIIGERKGKHFFITQFTPPMPTDIRSRYACKRNIEGHQELVDMYHSQTQGCLQYLGEWHSHPQVNAFPSQKDLSEWPVTYNYLYSKENISDMICLILGTENDWLGLYCNGKLYTSFLVK